MGYQPPDPRKLYARELQQSSAQINKWLADRDKALAEGYSKQGYKFSDPKEAETFQGLLGEGKLQAGASIGDGEYMVVRAGSLPSGYQEVGQVSGAIASPYAERKLKGAFGVPVGKNPEGPEGYWAPTRGFDFWANDGYLGANHSRRNDPVALYEPGSSEAQNLVIAKRGSMAAANPDPAKPFTPSPELETARERAKTYLDTNDDAGAGGSPGRGASGPYSDDLISNINLIDNRADGYQRRFLKEFLPGLQNTAEVAAREVGEAGRYALGQLAADVKPPVLSDPFSDSSKISDDSLFAQLQQRIKDSSK